LAKPDATSVLSKHIIPLQMSGVVIVIIRETINTGTIIFAQSLKVFFEKKSNKKVEINKYGKKLYRGQAISLDQKNSHKPLLLQSHKLLIKLGYLKKLVK